MFLVWATRRTSPSLKSERRILVRPLPSFGHYRVEIQLLLSVWRARHLPFGNGVLSLPHRGENYLEFWRRDQPQTPVERIVGHEDVVKEYVWRTRGGLDPTHGKHEGGDLKIRC